jgi:hypothetical protein
MNKSEITGGRILSILIDDEGYRESTKEKYDEFVKIRNQPDRNLIGYTEREEGFYPMYESPKGSIVTQAFILCKYCSDAISPVMGPRYDAVCITCHDKEPELR